MAFQLMGNWEYPTQRMFEMFWTPNDRFAYFNRMREFYRQWNWNQDQSFNQAWTTIKTMKDRFQMNVDVQHFAPEEISVKVVDGFVVVECQHDEKQEEHGYISRHFTRRYRVPEGYNADLVESKLSSDGVLTIFAEKFMTDAKNVRAVPIVQTGPIRKEMRRETMQVSSTVTEN